MKAKLLTLVSVVGIVAVSVAFTFPRTHVAKSQPVAAKTNADKAPVGGLTLDSKD